MMLNSKKADVSSIPSTTSGATTSSSYQSTYSPPPQNSTAYGGNNANHSIVDIHLTMKGDLESDGDVLVKGKVIGNIRCKLLIVDVDAIVDGGVECEEVVIRGRTKGTISANRVKLEKTATVDSEIEHCVFSAEEGARVKGSLRYRDEPISRTSPVSLVA